MLPEKHIREEMGERFFRLVEKHKQPSTILWRAVELKLLSEWLEDVKGKIVMDLGCGEGLVAGILFEKPIAFGLDNKSEMVRRAEKSGRYRKVIKADANRIPLPDESVDIVVSNSVLEHIANEKVIEEISRILKDGGRLLFTVPSDKLEGVSVVASLLGGMVGKIYGEWRNRKFNHYHCLNLGEWQIRLKKVGLSIKRHQYYLSDRLIIRWDGLLFVDLGFRQISKKLPWWVYKRCLRRSIYRLYREEIEKKMKKGNALLIEAVKVGSER